MPRQARKKSESGIYHVMLRGINRQQIFEDEEDFQKFIRTIRGRFSVQLKIKSKIKHREHRMIIHKYRDVEKIYDFYHRRYPWRSI